MGDLATRSRIGRPHADPPETAQTPRNRTIRAGYLTASLILIAVYPMLSAAGRDAALLLASLGAIPAVLAASRRAGADDRSPWMLLLAALALVSLANLIALLVDSPSAASLSGTLDAAGNVFVLATAVVAVMRQGHDNLGAIVDTTIAALAVGGVFWDVLLSPNLLADHQARPAKLALCVVVFSLCGVLGALAQLVILRPVAALGPLIIAVILALFAYTVPAVTTNSLLTTAAGMMFIGVYTAVGLVGLDPTTSQLITPAPARPRRLTVRRLVFLGLAVATVPVVVGVRQISGSDRDGLVLIVSSAAITSLVMVRIGQLSAQRDQAIQELAHAAIHDDLTGLLKRTEFVTRLRQALDSGHRCAIVFCDLDRFKAVNDRFGHANGDKLLIEVAKRLRASVRTDDLVSRFGGDEFVILLRDTTPDELYVVNRRIIETLSRPVQISGEPVPIGASIGTALGNGEIGAEELITLADHAMYASKIAGK